MSRSESLTPRLALHTWTLDSTPLAGVLRVARATGWAAVELRRIDFARAAEAGQPAEAVLDLVRASGLPVACVGGQLGWMFAEGPERRRLLDAMAESCRWAAALHCPTVMSPADVGVGPLDRAVEGVRAVGDLAAQAGVRVAIEAPSAATQMNTLARVREVLARADHPRVGLLVDAYHLQRGDAGLPALDDVRPEEIAYVQFSDVPAGPVDLPRILDRLPPGAGVVPFRDFFARIQQKGYRGFLSYEAPNPAAWARDPQAVAAEALAATRAVLPEA
jgi:sugar phosphate isomerase/epimerase